MRGAGCTPFLPLVLFTRLVCFTHRLQRGGDGHPRPLLGPGVLLLAFLCRRPQYFNCDQGVRPCLGVLRGVAALLVGLLWTLLMINWHLGGHRHHRFPPHGWPSGPSMPGPLPFSGNPLETCNEGNALPTHASLLACTVPLKILAGAKLGCGGSYLYPPRVHSETPFGVGCFRVC